MGEQAPDATEANKDSEVDAEAALQELQALLKLNLAYIEPLKPCAEILPHLILGSCDDARNREVLKRLGVTHVLNCASANVITGAEFYKPFGIEYTEFAAEDTQGFNIMEHYELLASLADAAQAAGGKLFTHCEAGVNRSGTLCVAYHVAHTKMPLLSSARHCKEQRGRICTNTAFQKQLWEFARSKGLA